MVEADRWTALAFTALTDHEPFCRYGASNGREMCTCEVLVALEDVAALDRLADDGGVVDGPDAAPSKSRAQQRKARLDARKPG